MKIYLDTIGCRLNQAEIENYARQFRSVGHELVGDPSQADLAVINTCTVTAAAAADSRKKIRGMRRAGVPQVVVTGCWSSLEPQQAAALVGGETTIPNLEKDNLVPIVLGIAPEDLEMEPILRQPIPGRRARTRAFIKIQDGCDNRCTYCITTLARGSSRSRQIPAILADIQAALAGGAQEIVLTGVHLGSWGHDFPDPHKLDTLVAAILKETETPRLRLSSLEPWDIGPDFFDLWQDPRLARHLHLPLQSGCQATLKRMARKTTPEAYAHLVLAARTAIPGVAITTDIIVGFPGETDEEFRQSLDFVTQMGFARGHVFTYSERPGTVAAHLPNPVPYTARKARNLAMQTVFGGMEQAFRERFVGKPLEVLWERARGLQPGTWELTGLSDNYLKVSRIAHSALWNQVETVQITGTNGKGLVGEKSY